MVLELYKGYLFGRNNYLLPVGTGIIKRSMKKEVMLTKPYPS
jgi:hypothetical protein